MTRVDLPEPETPVTQVITPRGMVTSMPRRLLAAAPRSVRQPFGWHRLPGRGIAQAPGQVVAGQRLRGGEDGGWRPLGDDPPAVHAGPRTHVDDMVGLEDRLLVVLDHQHGVTEVAQTLESVEQAAVVALVQADGRFVEDIEYADQGGTDLGGQANPLPLAAGEGPGGPVEGQVVEADPGQEGQPLADLLEHPAGDLRLARRQFESGEERLGRRDAQGAELADVAAADAHRQGSRLQARTAAGRAGPDADELLEPLALLLRFGFLQAPLQVRQ